MDATPITDDQLAELLATAASNVQLGDRNAKSAPSESVAAAWAEFAEGWEKIRIAIEELRQRRAHERRTAFRFEREHRMGDICEGTPCLATSETNDNEVKP